VSKETNSDQYSDAETLRRFNAALRGARIAGAKHRIVTPKRAKKQRKTRKK
jgi:hypothetical protein